MGRPKLVVEIHSKNLTLENPEKVDSIAEIFISR